MNFLLLDRSEAERTALARLIARCLGCKPVFYCYKPSEVFDIALPRDIHAAFITIAGIADVEATRKYARIYEEVPLVAVSDSEEYSIECYRFNAKYYLKRPVSVEELAEALKLCDLRTYSGEVQKIWM